MLQRFEPAQYSIPDLRFLLEHVGKSPAVAFRQPLEPGTHRNTLDEVLRAVYEHEEIKRAEDDYQWAGIEAITDSISRFLAWHDRSRELQRRGARDAAGALITYPSMYMWDEDGRAYKYAVDADAGDMVRTEILADGSRRPFGITLSNAGGDERAHISDIAPWVKTSAQAAREDDKVVEEKSAKNPKVGHLRCTICDETQSFDPKNQQTRRLAMARMHRHMKTAKVSVNRHRILLARMAH